MEKHEKDSVEELNSNSKRLYSLEIQKNAENINFKFNERFGLNSDYFKKFIDLLPENADFSEWKAHFSTIYHDSHLDRNLFYRHCYLLFVCQRCFQILHENIKTRWNIDLNAEINNAKVITKKYFNFLHSIDSDNSVYIKSIQNALNDFFELIFSQNIEIIDIFNLFYQEIIIPNQRHKLGEFFTPIPLVNLMVTETYELGSLVLDPACGTGTFLVEIIRKIFKHYHESPNLKILESIKHLYGVEINPITINVTKLNLITYITHQYILIDRKYEKESDDRINPSILTSILETINRHLFNKDFLLNSSSEFKSMQGFDLIIGNPPWLVINGVNSLDYKLKLKTLAEKLEIGSNTQNISNMELSSLFFAKSVSELLNASGKIFFVTSAGIMTGSQNDRLRQFKGLKNIRIWKFDKDLFNIHNICVYAEKGEQEIEKKYKIPVETKKCKDDPIEYLDGTSEIYVPIYVNNDGKNNKFGSDLHIGRLIPEEKHFNLDQPSLYQELFRQGACLGPRNLLYCQINPYTEIQNTEKENIVSIQPDLSVQYKKYSKWDFIAYEKAEVELDYIYTSAKSTQLIPFLLLATKILYIPVPIFKQSDLSTKYYKAKNSGNPFEPYFGKNTYAEQHFKTLNKIYVEHMKSGAAIPTLIENMNHNNKLFNSNQQAKYKIVYNGIGSIVKSAIVQGNIVIDSSLYYYTPENEDEAYYLMGVLNSNIVTERVKKIGSTGSSGSLRNIHKNPLKLNIPKYENTKTQNKIVKLSKELENYALNTASKSIQSEIEEYIQKQGFCQKCGKVFLTRNVQTHITKCNKNKDYSVVKQILSILGNDTLQNLNTPKKIKKLIQKKEFMKSILNSPKNQKPTDPEYEGIVVDAIKDSRNFLFKRIMEAFLKPKTIQNLLLRDKKFTEKLRRLNKYVVEII
ncbi:MAG: N-6 DNA methylase [Candidatus Lokiarchaeota archaeon]|nr:N-6 DNA methylase [Candidatus Lokiarchaeota archaeon]